MSKTLAELESAAMSLSDKDRAALAHRLIETLDHDVKEDVEEAWLAEAERRYEDCRKGLIQKSPAEVVHKEARESLG